MERCCRFGKGIPNVPSDHTITIVNTNSIIAILFSTQSRILTFQYHSKKQDRSLCTYVQGSIRVCIRYKREVIYINSIIHIYVYTYVSGYNIYNVLRRVYMHSQVE